MKKYTVSHCCFCAMSFVLLLVPFLLFGGESLANSGGMTAKPSINVSENLEKVNAEQTSLQARGGDRLPEATGIRGLNDNPAVRKEYAFTYDMNEYEVAVTGLAEGCGELSELIIPEYIEGIPVRYILDEAFEYCDNLISVRLPKTLYYIGNEAFKSCYYLRSVYLPEKIEYIGYRAFAECPHLININLPQSIMKMEREILAGSLYYNEHYPLRLTLPMGISSIHELTFYGVGVSFISIPDTVVSLGEEGDSCGVFENCSELTVVSIGNGVSYMNEATFNDCDSLTTCFTDNDYVKAWFAQHRPEIRVLSLSNVPLTYSAENDYVIITGLDEDYRYIPELVIPATIEGLPVIGIEGEAFSGCYNLFSVSLPSTVEFIGSGAFFECCNLNRISLPWGIRSIERYAFSFCSHLTGINLPNTIDHIGECAFLDCFYDSLEPVSLALPAFIYCIDGGSFCRAGVTEVSIPDTVTALGDEWDDDGVFEGCNRLESVSIGNDVSYMNEATFDGCDSLTTCYTNNDYVKSWFAQNLPNVTILPRWISTAADRHFLCISDDITYLTPEEETWQFIQRCQNLRAVFIGNGVAFMDEDTFAASEHLTICYTDNDYVKAWFVRKRPDVKLFSPAELLAYSIDGDEVTITGYADGVQGPIDLMIPETIEGHPVVAIQDNAFDADWLRLDDSAWLTSLYIPKTVRKIRQLYSSHNWDGEEIPVQHIEVAEDNSWYASKDGVLFDADFSILICYPPAKGDASYAVPDSVVVIKSDAFMECHNLLTVALPPFLKYMGTAAFAQCERLQQMNIPDGVTEIADDLFLGCYDLRSVSLPNTVEIIGYSAFCSCRSLISINLPDTVESIGGYAFAECENLPSLALPPYVSYIGDGALGMCPSLESLTLASSNEFFCVEESVLYDKAKNSLIFYSPGKTDTVFTVPESVTDIYSGAFSYAKNLTRINLPEGITAIKSSTFEGCSALTEMKLPASVKSIASSAFCDCSSLRSINLPEEMTTIGQHTFYGCRSLSHIELPSGLLKIDHYAFGSSGLTQITIPEGVYYIGQRAFYDCDSLTHITFPASVKTIDWAACSYSGNLATAIFMGDPDVFLSANLFDYCPKLTDVWTRSEKVRSMIENNYPNVTIHILRDGDIINYALRRGWNLISVPFEIDVEKGGDEMLSISPLIYERLNDAYVCVTQSMKAGTGAWVFSDKKRTIQIWTDNGGESEPRLQTDLQKGWNLTGICGTKELLLDCVVKGVTAIWTWNGRTFHVIPIENGVALLKPGVGYWIRLDK